MPLRVINIAEGTSVDGPGLRTSIYFAGCEHACPGCHNPESWPFDAGSDWSVEKLMSVVRFNRFDVTFSGGDPMYQAEALLPLAQQIKAAGYNICAGGRTLRGGAQAQRTGAALPRLREPTVHRPRYGRRTGVLIRNRYNQ